MSWKGLPSIPVISIKSLKSSDFRKPKKGFGLIELSIALLIIGLILGSIFKGRHLVETARIQSVVRQLQEIRNCLDQYMGRYGVWPGLDSEASNRFNTTFPVFASYTSDESTQTGFYQLKEAGLINHRPIPKLGGTYFFETVDQGHFITLAEEYGKGGILTLRQAEEIKRYLASDGDFVLIRGEGKYILSYQFA